MRKAIFGFLLVLSTGSSLLAGEISVSQSVDKPEVAFSDSVRFEIELRWEGNQMAYLFDKALDPYIENMKVKRFASSIGSSMTGEGEFTTKRFLFVLQPTVAGVGRIEPIEISYISWPDSIPGSLVTEAMTVNIAPPAEVKVASKSYWWLWTLLAVVLLGTGVAITAAIVRGRRRAVEVVKTPRELVLEELAVARGAAGMDIKKFQTDVYKILGAFVQRQYGVSLSETVGEALEERLMRVGMEHGAARKIAGWLTRAEKDKYSPAVSGPGEAVRLESEMREFFEKMQI